jgi:RHS repeat-associated protein
VLLGGWVDTTPLTSGAFLSLRTDGSIVSFDDIEVYQAKRYYYAGDRRIALRDNGVLSYLLPDHLGGTHITASGTNGTETGKLLYKPWGETRYSAGTTPTTWRFTGQREDATIGLYFYNARYLDPQLGRFTQADTIVPEPGDPQALNRYAYGLNNPLRYTDPTGMFSEDEIMAYLGVSTWDDVLAMFGEGGVMAGAWGFLEVLRQAELGTPVSMWFDAGSGFNASQPNMMGMFSEQNGALVFSGAFLDWSGAGGSWSIGGLAAVTASTLLPATGQYQVGRSGGYIGAGSPYNHVGFDLHKVNWQDVQIGLWAASSDIGGAVAVAGAASLDPLLAQFGALWWVGANAANWYSLAATVADWQRGNATAVDLSVSAVTTVFGTIPVTGLYFDVIGIGYDVSKGLRWTP